MSLQLMYINGLADTVASDKYGGHVFEMTRVTDQDGKTVRAALVSSATDNLWRAASWPHASRFRMFAGYWLASARHTINALNVDLPSCRSRRRMVTR